MIDIDKLYQRFLQFGGWRLFCQYTKMGVLWMGCKALLRCVIRGVSMKVAYPMITQRVDEILVKRYRHIADGNEEGRSALENSTEHSDRLCKSSVPKIVWFAWLQGLDKAPDIVKACLDSQKRNLPDYEFRVVDLDNFRAWIMLPDYVVEKYYKGWIPPALFSDLLRLSLLKKYGGIWLDASVFCTGFGNDHLKARWQHVMNSELTLFRYYDRRSKQPIGLSNWFIAAVPRQIVIATVLDMLLAYWKDFDCTVDYYICHLFFGVMLREYHEVWVAMPRENSSHSLLLGNALAQDYSEDDWQELIAHVSFHKINYRKAEKALLNSNSYCQHLLDTYKNQ